MIPRFDSLEPRDLPSGLVPAQAVVPSPLTPTAGHGPVPAIVVPVVPIKGSFPPVPSNISLT
jgi:hypothetical protein